MPRLLDHINFAKVAIVLAIVFVIALGLCGVTGYIGSRPGASGATLPFGIVELAAMILSAAGLVLTLVAWVIVSILRVFGYKEQEPQRLFDNKEQ